MNKRIGAAALAITSGLALAVPGEITHSVASDAPVRAAVAATPDGHWCAATLNGQVFCVDERRQPRWRSYVAAPVSTAPLVQDEVLVVASQRGVHGLALDSGKPLWNIELPARPAGPSWDSYQAEPLALDGGELLLIHGSQALRLRAHDGAQIWRRTLPQPVMASPSLIDAGRHALLADTQGRVHKLDLGDGRLAASWAVSERLIQGRPAVRGQTAWVGGRDAMLRAYDLHQGRELWRAAHHTNWLMAAPVLLGEAVISAESDGFMIQARQATDGTPLWHFGLGQNVYQTPAVDGTTLLIASGQAYQADALGLVTAISGQGKRLWQRSLPANAFARPVLVGRHVVVGTENGQIHEIALD